MIHAYLFVTKNNRDHDAHGPEFLKLMGSINEVCGHHKQLSVCKFLFLTLEIPLRWAGTIYRCITTFMTRLIIFGSTGGSVMYDSDLSSFQMLLIPISSLKEMRPCCQESDEQKARDV
jgi:hypothetical protein